MAFSERLKTEAKRKSNFRCCICEKIKPLEIHHIIPENENGESIIDNAAPLCAGCHDVYGDNPRKKKWIRDKRDHWWDICSVYYDALIKEIPSNLEFDKILEPKLKDKITEKAIAIYHNVFYNEGFEKSAKILFELVKRVQKEHPNKKRVLYLDIEGHRNKIEGYDADMFELQKDFTLGFLAPYLSEIYIPLIAIRNKKPQINDIPDKLMIFKSKKEAEKYKEEHKENNLKLCLPK